MLRDSNGNLTGIQAPFGQVTKTTLDPNGYLASIQTPNSETYQMTYLGTGGLLQTFQKPNGEVSTMSYTSDGLLTQDSSSAGSSTSFSVPSNDGTTLSFSTASALGRSTSYAINDVALGGESRSTTLPDGSSSLTSWIDTGSTPDVTNNVIDTRGSGEFVDLSSQADPRFGLAMMYNSTTRQVYSGSENATSIATSSRMVAGFNLGSNAGNTPFFNYTSIDNQTTTNGNLWDISLQLQI